MDSKVLKLKSQDAKDLLERLPKLQGAVGSRHMVKFGGAAMEQPSTREAVCREIALLSQLGILITAVHGGGHEITRLLDKLSIPSRFIAGVRVTTQEGMTAIEMVLSGLINKDLASRITRYGAPAVGISGRDADCIQAVQYRNEAGDNFGETGDFLSCNPRLIETLLDSRFVPVVSPVGESTTGAPRNLNADIAAAGIAGSIRAERAIFLTDVPGVRVGESVVSSLTAKQVHELIANGTITGGMIPKVQCALRALSDRCRYAVICNAAAPDIVSRAVLGLPDAGTVIVAGGV